MFRTLIPIIAAATGIGWASSNIDPQMLQKIEGTIRGITGQASPIGEAGSIDIPDAAAQAVGALQSRVSAPARNDAAVPVADEVQGNRKAFFNKLPADCAWERVINMNGQVSCTVPGRDAR